MQSSELKAVLTKTNEVAARPVPISNDHLTSLYAATRNRNRVYTCPTGLIKCVVIGTGAKWTERRTVSQCGDTTYDIARKNGVLVEFVMPEGEEQQSFYKKAALTKITEREGVTYVQQIISPRVIYSAWGEYALIEAQRQKDREVQSAKSARLRDAQAALMGTTREAIEKRKCGAYLPTEYETEYEYDDDGNYKRDAKRNRIVKGEVGRITITIDAAEKILGLLTDEQKAALSS